MPTLTTAIASLASAAAACAGAASAGAADASDDLLLDQQRQLAASARLIEVAASALAAEVAHRSRRELGYDGLAQKRGARTPEALVQQVTGSSSPTARRLVRIGVMVAEVAAHDADATRPVTEPWLAVVLRSVAAGALSGEALEAIRAGLGGPSEAVSEDALAGAARILTLEAPSVTLERLGAHARELRDELDFAGVAEREEERRQRRYLRLLPQTDGMTRIVGLLDPESAAVVGNAISAATSPRLGGVRFVRPEDVARAQAIIDDPRTTEQLALDALVELVGVAVRARDNNILGIRRADVRLLVTQKDLDRREGVGFIDGQTATVSVATIERHVCDGGLVPIVFDEHGKALNLGRSQRLHNARQRTVITARDGGCLGPDCERTASWSEVHHINEYGKGGNTDLDDGVLLCRYHHMLVHNNGWRIRRTESQYWLIPPPFIDPEQIPILLQSKSPALRRVLAVA